MTTTTSSAPIESIQLSIQNLINTFLKRSEWKHFLNPSSKQQNLNNNTQSWRKNLTHILQSTPVEVVSISLVLIDLIITVYELTSSLISCNNQQKPEDGVWYHWVGMGILTLLSVKTVCVAVGVGVEFLKRPGYVVDGVVVIGAVIMEGFVERKGGGLLLVVSLWRVLRILESAFELSDEAIEAQIQSVVCQLVALQDQNAELRRIIAEKDERIQQLQQELDGAL